MLFQFFFDNFQQLGILGDEKFLPDDCVLSGPQTFGKIVTDSQVNCLLLEARDFGKQRWGPTFYGARAFGDTLTGPIRIVHF